MNIWGVLLALSISACTVAGGPPKKEYAQPVNPYVQRSSLEFQGDNSSLVYFLDQSLTAKACRWWGAASENALACAGGGVMILPNPCEFAEEEYAQIVCHELSHSNGWSHD